MLTLMYTCALQTGYLGLQMQVLHVSAGVYIHLDCIQISCSACSFKFTHKSFEEVVQSFYKVKQLSFFSFQLKPSVGAMERDPTLTRSC